MTHTHTHNCSAIIIVYPANDDDGGRRVIHWLPLKAKKGTPSFWKKIRTLCVI